MSRDEQLPHVLDREHVGVDHHGPALVAHQLGRHEAQRRERLQVLLVPDAAVAVAAVGAALVLGEEVLVGLVLDQLDVELVGMARVAPHRVHRHQRAEILLVVGVDEHAWLHDGGLLAAARCERSIHSTTPRAIATAAQADGGRGGGGLLGGEIAEARQQALLGQRVEPCRAARRRNSRGSRRPWRGAP